MTTCNCAYGTTCRPLDLREITDLHLWNLYAQAIRNGRPTTELRAEMERRGTLTVAGRPLRVYPNGEVERLRRDVDRLREELKAAIFWAGGKRLWGNLSE